MFEVKVNIESASPDLAEAICKLAEAIKGLTIPTMIEPVKVMETEQEAPAVTEEVPPVLMMAEQTVPMAEQHVQEATQQPTEPPVMLSEAQPTVNTPAVMAASEDQENARVIDLDTISRAGAALIDQGKMADVLALLHNFGVMAVNQLDPSQYPAFADGMRALGASI